MLSVTMEAEGSESLYQTSPAAGPPQPTPSLPAPIVEPEIDIHCPEKAKAEGLLKAAILEKLDKLPAGQLVMLKLTLPEQDDLYLDLIKHPKVVRVVALSGGYSQEDADDRLRKDHGMVASFSRALLEGLSAQQSDAEFNSVLEKSIQNIFDASNTKQPTIFESDWNPITKAAGTISEKDSRYGQR